MLNVLVFSAESVWNWIQGGWLIAETCSHNIHQLPNTIFISFMWIFVNIRSSCVNKISVLYSFISINIRFCGRVIVTGETPKYVKKILLHCYCSYHKSQKQWPGVAVRRNCKLFFVLFQIGPCGHIFTEFPSFKVCMCPSRAGLSNIWHAAFNAIPIFFFNFFRPTSVPILWKISAHLHISDCVQIVYKSPLLPINTASKTFLHESEAVRSVDWIFISGEPVWRWLGEYVTLNKILYSLFWKQEDVAAPATARFSFLSHSSTRPLLEI
jgi:hypothetical protein